MPGDTVEPEHRGQADDARDRIEDARRTVRDQAVLREIPVGFAVLRDGLIRDSDQDRCQQGEAAGYPLPPHPERPAQRALQLRTHVAPCIRIADRELEVDAEQPFARGLLQRCDQQRLDGHPGRGDQHRRHQRMADPERRVVADHAGGVQLGQEQRQHEAPDGVIEQARRETVPRPRFARPAGFRALELRHAQLEDPARVFLWRVGPQKDAFLAAPVEYGDVGLRHQRRQRDDPAPPHERDTMHHAVDQRQDEQRERQPHQDLLGDQHRVGRRDEDDGARDKSAEQRAQRKAPRNGAPERRDDALGQSRVVQRLLQRAAR